MTAVTDLLYNAGLILVLILFYWRISVALLKRFDRTEDLIHTEISKVDAKIEGLRKEIKEGDEALRKEINATRRELSADIKEVRTDVKRISPRVAQLEGLLSSPLWTGTSIDGLFRKKAEQE